MQPYIILPPPPRPQRDYRRAGMILGIWTGSALVSLTLIIVAYVILS